MPKNKHIQIISEWTDFFTNKHYMLLVIEGHLMLEEIEMNWREK
jgi:hypothetical protein